MKNQEERRFIVYLVTCMANGKRYVGITAFALVYRWTQHVQLALRATRKGALQGAIVKYGADQFKIEIIREVIGLTAACEAEREEIVARSTIWPDGYNMNDGGNARAGFAHSGETKRKMREAAAGRIIPASTREKSAKTLRRLWTEPEYREKMTVARATEKVRTASRESGRRLGLAHGGYMAGKKHTPEAIAKMSAASKGRPAWNKGKPMLPHVKEKLIALSTGRPSAKRGIPLSEETKAKMRANRKPLRHTDEAKAKIAAASRGRAHTPESKAKLSAFHKGRPVSEETKAKLSAIFRGRKFTPEQIAQQQAKSAVTKALKLSGSARVRALLAQLDDTCYPRDWEKNLFIGAKQMPLDFGFTSEYK